jgi:hypothetical protein
MPGRTALHRAGAGDQQRTEVAIAAVTCKIYNELLKKGEEQLPRGTSS